MLISLSGYSGKVLLLSLSVNVPACEIKESRTDMKDRKSSSEQQEVGPSKEGRVS